MFSFTVIKEIQLYLPFRFILKFKLRWKLWPITEVCLLPRLLSPAPFYCCVQVLPVFM